MAKMVQRAQELGSRAADTIQAVMNRDIDHQTNGEGSLPLHNQHLMWLEEHHAHAVHLV